MPDNEKLSNCFRAQLRSDLESWLEPI